MMSGISGTPMKDKKSKWHLGNWCGPLQDQESDILERVDKRMFQYQLETACGRINSKDSDERKHSNSNSTRGLVASTPEPEKHGIHEPSTHEST